MVHYLDLLFADAGLCNINVKDFCYTTIDFRYNNNAPPFEVEKSPWKNRKSFKSKKIFTSK